MSVLRRSYFVTTFIGRSQETKDLCGLVERARLVSVVGPGGVGKTRLAYEAFDTLATTFVESWAVELADLKNPDTVVAEIATAIGAPTHAETIDVGLLVDRIGSTRALLMVDNCEHLLEPCAELLGELLRRCPQLHVLTTSRQHLGIVGEHVLEAPPLTPHDAVDLFVARAQALIPHWKPSEHDRAVTTDVCTRLAGNALSIELAASLMRTLTPEALKDRVADQLGTLRLDRGTHGRHGSLEACLTWSLDLCTPDERTLLARLSVFPGDFPLDAAERICSDDRLPGARVAAALRGLVDKSLVELVSTTGHGRYRLLESVQQFAASHLTDDESDLLRVHHRDFYLRMTQEFESGWFGSDQFTWYAWFRVEQANLRTAFDFSLAAGNGTDAALQMCTILEHYVGSAGGAGESLRWIRQACNQPYTDVVARAEALRVGVFVACIMSALDTAHELHADLVAMGEHSGVPRVRACVLYASAVIRAWSGEPKDGSATAEEAIAAYADLGDRGRVANLIFLKAMMLGWADEPEAAAECYRRCFEITRPLGEAYWNSYAQWGLGVDLLLTGDVDGSLQMEREALVVKAAFDDTLGLGLTLEAIAWCAIEQRDARLAHILFGATDRIWAYLGVPLSGVPFLLRRRDAALAALAALGTADADALRAMGASMSTAVLVDVVLGRVPLPNPVRGRTLTRREGEIALLIASGCTNREIAERLVISPRTVESHVERILRKLDVRSRTDVGKAIR